MPPRFVVDSEHSPQLSALLGARVVDRRVASCVTAGVARRIDGRWIAVVGSAGAAALDTPFDLASVSKPFLAVLVARLVALGRLDWRMPLVELLPEVPGATGHETLEALLSHRAGLVAHVELFRSFRGGAPVERARWLDEAARARRPNDHAAPVYSDLGYLLVGAALSSALGSALDALVTEHVLAPLGLVSIGSSRMFQKRADFFREVAPTEIEPARGGLVRGVVHDDNAWTIAGSGFAGHAGLFGTLGGVLDFGAALLDGLAGRGTLADLVTELVRERPGGTLRLGFDGISGPTSRAGTRAGPRTFGHLGFTGTSLWCDPERDSVTVLLTNRVHPSRANPRLFAARPEIHDRLWELADELADRLVP